MSRRRKEGNCGRQTSCDSRVIGFIMGGERGLWRVDWIFRRGEAESGCGHFCSNRIRLRQQSTPSPAAIDFDSSNGKTATCYAHSSVSICETIHAMKSRESVELSVQHLFNSIVAVNWSVKRNIP